MMEQDGTNSDNHLKSNPGSLSFCTQPDEMVDHIFSWCDFGSLVALRSTNHRLKGIAENVLERGALESLPVFQKIQSDAFAFLRLDWFTADQDTLVGNLLRIAASMEPNIREKYSKDRQILQSWGNVGSEDIGVDLSETARRLDIDFHHSISVTAAWEAARSMLFKVEDNRGLEETTELESVPLRQFVFSLLVSARPSIRRATLHHECHGTNYASSCKADALMFLTSDNRRFELYRLSLSITF
jgi:hypothetical protein